MSFAAASLGIAALALALAVHAYGSGLSAAVVLPLTGAAWGLAVVAAAGMKR